MTVQQTVIQTLIWRSHQKAFLNNLKKENLLEQVEDKYIKSIINDEITYFDANNKIRSRIAT